MKLEVTQLFLYNAHRKRNPTSDLPKLLSKDHPLSFRSRRSELSLLTDPFTDKAWGSPARYSVTRYLFFPQITSATVLNTHMGTETHIQDDNSVAYQQPALRRNKVMCRQRVTFS